MEQEVLLGMVSFLFKTYEAVLASNEFRGFVALHEEGTYRMNLSVSNNGFYYSWPLTLEAQSKDFEIKVKMTKAVTFNKGNYFFIVGLFFPREACRGVGIGKLPQERPGASGFCIKVYLHCWGLPRNHTTQRFTQSRKV